VFLEPLAGCGGSAVASGVAGGDARLGEGQNAQLAGEDGGGQRKDGEAPESLGDGCCNTQFWTLD